MTNVVDVIMDLDDLGYKDAMLGQAPNQMRSGALKRHRILGGHDSWCSEECCVVMLLNHQATKTGALSQRLLLVFPWLLILSA